MTLKRNRGIFLALSLLLGLLGACQSPQPTPPTPAVPASTGPVTIWQATDLHFLSPELTDCGELFQSVMDTNDGKLTEYSGELVDRFLEMALEAEADAVVLTGDLTFGGEKQSLTELTGKLQKVREAGLPVLVLPGNHDIDSTHARNYFGQSSYPVESVSHAAFTDLCSPFGRDQALYRDEASFSYIYALGQELWLVLLDANTGRDAMGRVPEDTLTWLEDCLREAGRQNVTVLSFSHQNLLPVNDLYSSDFVISNCQAVLDLYREYGVHYSFSGHSHIQHETAGEDGLTEIVTGPLCVSPLHYGVITAQPDRVDYAAGTMPIYQEEAYERFREPMLRGMTALLDTYDLTEEERALMADYAVTLNMAYFAGDTDAVEGLRDAPGWRLWEEKAFDSFWYTYMWSIFE